jgi:hypothetical protein
LRIDLVLHQLARQLIETVAPATSEAGLEVDALVLDPAKLVQRFPRPTFDCPACWPWTASGARTRLTDRTTTSPITRMSTSVEDGWRGV